MTDDREIKVLQFRLREALHACQWALNYINDHPASIERQDDRAYFLHRLGRVLGRGKVAPDVAHDVAPGTAGVSPSKNA